MSIDININVNDRSLLDQVRLQQDASRQTQVEKESNQRLGTQASSARTASLATQGLDSTGKQLTDARSRIPQGNRRPAAYRPGGSNESMCWVMIGLNSWEADLAYITDYQLQEEYSFSNSPTYTGSNQGRPLYICSRDGTYWYQETFPGAPGGFEPGALTSYQTAPWSDFYPSGNQNDQGINEFVLDVFPVGNGDFIISLRHTRAYCKGTFARDFRVFSPGNTEGIAGLYKILVSESSGVIHSYKSYLVTETNVTPISTPGAVEQYFADKFPTWIEHPLTLRAYTNVGSESDFGTLYFESRSVDNPNLNGKFVLYDYGSIPCFRKVQGRLNRTTRNPQIGNIPTPDNPTGEKRYPEYWWLNGWWQRAMPLPPVLDMGPARSTLHGSPAIYSRANNSNINFSNYFPNVYESGTKIGRVVTEDPELFNPWFEASYVQDQTKMKRAIAYDPSSFNSLFLTAQMQTPLSIYEAISDKPTGYEWFLPSRTPPSNASFWKKTKELSFSENFLPPPSFPLVGPTDSLLMGDTLYFNFMDDRILCVCTDWGDPKYCKQQAQALGFSV